MKCAFTLIGILLVSRLTSTHATEYPLPPANSHLIGENITFIVPDDGRSLEMIAANYKIGLLGMLEANPDVDPHLPAPGSVLTIPPQILLPDAPRKGIIINLAELRLYYYPQDQNKVIVYPVGIGQRGRSTPIMTTSVIEKIPNPTWIPTPNIRKRYLAEGIVLPAVMPAGPKNPMGLFALRLAANNGVYVIHGTNANFGIGLRVTSGCIRLRPDDIQALFNAVPKGTRVQIINDPLQFSIEPDGKRYVEVHQPLSKTDSDNPQVMPITLNNNAKKFIADDVTDAFMVEEAIVRRAGTSRQLNEI